MESTRGEEVPLPSTGTARTDPINKKIPKNPEGERPAPEGSMTQGATRCGPGGENLFVKSSCFFPPFLS